jgi:predicted ATPase
MGLHPAWQSKLADMIAEARKEKGLHFIIETHSDHIINKLRYLVASGNLESSDVVIQFFDRNCNSGTPGTTEISISENGELSMDIPTGFSDNTDLETLGMFTLRKIGKN